MYITGIIKQVSPAIRSFTRSASYFITTPIFYVNSSPHIGHVHTLFLADALNIYMRLKLGTDDTIFSTGTDEHGIKIQTAAEVSGMQCSEFCDLNSAKFSRLFKKYNTTVTDFIRTSEERHVRSVQSIWNKLIEAGFVYKSTYSGWYCTSDEVFVPESQVATKVIDGLTIHVDGNDNKVVWSSEDNYMFRLSELEDRVFEWLNKKRPILPRKFNDELINQMEKARIGDISISRPKSRLEWGIEVPGDSSQTIYVWLDALTNYLTVAGYPCNDQLLRRWPIDCQVLGKDIIKFHAIYWPAFLMALSLPLPTKLVCHSHWLVDNLKMSKSRGNVIDPWQENKLLTQEGLRYYMLRASTTHSDTDYNRTQALRRVNAELADTYGNLLSRSCASAINPEQKIPINILNSNQPAGIGELIDRLDKLGQSCAEYFERADFYKGVDEIMSVLRLNNRLYEDSKPWKLIKEVKKDEQARVTYHNLQAVTFETLRICSILLQPITPMISKIALNHLEVTERLWQDARVKLSFDGTREAHRVVSNLTSPVLFRRIKD